MTLGGQEVDKSPQKTLEKHHQVGRTEGEATVRIQCRHMGAEVVAKRSWGLCVMNTGHWIDNMEVTGVSS